jgi:hypothetical protein
MYVDDPTRESGQHWFFQHPHEAGENDNLGSRVSQHLDQLFFDDRFEAGTKVTWRQVGVGDAELTRDLKDWRLQYVGNHYGGFRGQFAVPNTLQYGPAI